MANGIGKGDARGFNRGRSSKFRLGSPVRQIPVNIRIRYVEEISNTKVIIYSWAEMKSITNIWQKFTKNVKSEKIKTFTVNRLRLPSNCFGCC